MSATGSGFNWTPAFRGLIQDPYVQDEFDRLAAQLKAGFDEHSIVEAEKGLITGQAVPTRPSDDAGAAAQPGQRWLEGPWLLNADGDTAGKAVIRPPQITSTQNDYAPLGIDTCVGMALTSNGDQTITGIRVAARQTRLLYILNANRTSGSLTFPDSDVRSRDVHEFGLGVAGETLILPPGRLVWFLYDVVDQSWKLFAIPGVGFGNLPGSFQDGLSGFPPDYDWGGAKVYDGVSAAGLGEPAPTLAGAGTPFSSAFGNFRMLASAAVAGSSAGVDAGGTSLINLQHNPAITWWIRTGASIANVRIWILLTNTALTDADEIVTAGAEYVGFRFSTVVPDAGVWVAASRAFNGAAYVQTVVPTTFAIAPDTTYKLQIAISAGGVAVFTINDIVQLSKSSDMPAQTTQLFWSARVFTQAAAAKTLGWARTFWKATTTNP